MELDDESDTVSDVIADFHKVFDRCPPEVRRQVRRVVVTFRDEMVDALYRALEGDTTSGRFLPGPERRDRILHLLSEWLGHLFSAEDATEIAAVVAYQKQIGEVHARINLPPHLMIRGMSELRRDLIYRLADTPLDREALLKAADWVGTTMDVARAVIITSFVGGTERAARTDEAYRLFALGQNLQVERERQRAALLEWVHTVLRILHRPPPRAVLPLAGSEFGLWFRHKGVAMFEGTVEVRQIDEAIRQIDEMIVPRLATLRVGDEDGEPNAPLSLLDTAVADIKFHLGTLFEAHIEVENGRDPLTRLLSRRFVPIVLGREITLSRAGGGRSFSVAMVDIDDFKLVNDRLGHEAGDIVLQQTAATIANALRAGDFAFRYGGEEFLVCLTELSPREVSSRLDTLRRRIAASEVPLPNGVVATVTVSIGVVAFDGHPDFQQLISRADAALYRAKNLGRDRVEFG